MLIGLKGVNMVKGPFRLLAPGEYVLTFGKFYGKTLTEIGGLETGLEYILYVATCSDDSTDRLACRRFLSEPYQFAALHASGLVIWWNRSLSQGPNHPSAQQNSRDGELVYE